MPRRSRDDGASRDLDRDAYTSPDRSPTSDARLAAFERLVRDLTTRLDRLPDEIEGKLDSATAAVSERVAAAGRDATSDVDEAATRSQELFQAQHQRLEAVLGRIEERAQAALEGVLDRWDARLAGVRRATDDLADAAGRLVEETDRVARESGRGVEHLGEVVGRSNDVVGWLDASNEQLAAEIDRLQQETDRGRKALNVSRQHLETRLTATIDGATESFVSEATQAATTAAQASEQLQQTLGALADVEAVLGEHREVLESTLARDRDALLGDLIDRLVNGLSKRDRRRVAEELLEERRLGPGERALGQTPTPAPSPFAPPVVPDDPADGEVLGEWVEVDETDDPEGAQAAVEAARAELYEWVLAVPGIGPGRATALVDAYGDVDELAASTPDDVVEVAGIPKQLAEDVLAYVRG